MSFLVPRVTRIAVGLAAVSALAAAPIAAQAVAPTTNATGTLSAGSLSNTAPPITPFSATLTGLTQTVHATVGGWSVTDATGSNQGYSVTVSATAPTVAGLTIGAGTGGSITLTPTTASAASGNPAATGPVAQSAQTLGIEASTIETAAANTGQGEWDFAGDSVGTKNLAVVIPGNASAGSYSSTLTFTASPLAT